MAVKGLWRHDTTGARPTPHAPPVSQWLSQMRIHIFAAALLAQAAPTSSITWTFDRLENIGGHQTTVLGQPKVIDSPVGKAVLFNGVDDALFIGNHPLAGASTFTLEAVFRPDGGQTQQRWFHLSEQEPGTGKDTNNRMLFEIRVVKRPQ